MSAILWGEKLMATSGASLIIEYLGQRQINYVFLVPGKLIYPIVEKIAHSDHLEGIMATSELASGYMADGFARASGKVGVCLSIGGPGASNLLTSAINSRLEDSKVLFLTGDVTSTSQGIGAFQDSSSAGTRSVELFQQALNYSTAIAHSDYLLKELNQAFLNSPSHLLIPLDIQTHRYKTSPLEDAQWRQGDLNSREFLKEEIISDQFYEILNGNSKIMLLVGSQVIKNGQGAELLNFAETYHLPVTTTLSAKGAIPETHPLSLGVFGHGGNQRANQALTGNDIDTLLLVGLDFNQNESLEWDSRLYSGRRQVMRIDQLPQRFPSTVKIDLELIVDDCSHTLKKLSLQSQNQLQNLHQSIPQRLKWLKQLQAIPWHWRISPETSLFDQCLPLDKLIRALQTRLPSDTILCTDAGTTRGFAGHSWISSYPHSFFSSSKLAPMGWAICAGIGIQLARPESRVLVVTGDGSMMMHGMEIATAARYQLPILFVICNNRGYGNAYQRFKEDLKMNPFTLLPPINWIEFAKSLGVEAMQVKSISELDQALDRVLGCCHPFVMEVLTSLTYSIH